MDDVRDDLISRAQALAAIWAERAQKTEENRAPLDEAIAELVDSGLLSILTPKVYGGLELDIELAAEVVKTLSAGCTSTGWVAAFYIGAPWRANIFPERAQREIFAEKPYALMCGTAIPISHVEKVDGGYRITGQTAWNSGSQHAEWFTFNGIVAANGGTPGPHWFLVPREDVEVLDTWYIKGMSGTGSNDVVVDNVFVPDHRMGSFLAALDGVAEGQRVHENPMYHLPFLSFAMAEVTPVVVGAMGGMANAFVARTLERHGTLSHERASEKQSAQMRLGRALCAAGASDTLLTAALATLTPDRSERIDRAEMKLRSAFIANMCRDAANDIVRGVGADGFRDASPLQRFHRDLSVLATHAFLDIDTATETMSRFVLDLPVTDRLL